MLNLTRRERIVIVFLIVSFVVGGSIKLYKSEFDSQNAVSQIKKEQKEFKKKAKSKDDSSNFSQNSKDISNTKNRNKFKLFEATKQELMQIKGIGTVTAERILQYRKENEDIEEIQELTEIKGIGTKTIKTIKNEVTIE